ncbi:MAG: glycosyltransferase family 9 protein [Nitrospinae bacterium]|nr:glycosyltransferase family 9 protein [Nitrospinota bacterium]
MRVDSTAVRKILVIRLRSIGDILLTNPVLEALREGYPHATIDMLVDDLFVDVLYGNPNVDRVFPHTRRVEGPKWKSDLAFIRAVRRQKYDMVVDLQGGPRGAWLTFFSGARYRVGHPFRLRNRLAYNLYGEHPRPDDHSWLVQFKTIVNLGFPPPAKPRFHVDIDPAVKASVREKLERKGLLFDRPLVLLHPGARIDEKRWPAPKMGELARWLVDEKGAAVILAGGPADRGEVDAIRKASGYALPTFADLTVAELMALIGGVDLLVCNDSGPMHIAGAFDTPTVALFGPSDPALWSPVGDHHAILTPAPMDCMPCDQKGCPRSGDHCMTRIDIDAVKETVERFGLH